MRPENPKQTLDEFEFLGHKPYRHQAPIGDFMACSKCGGALGSQYGCNPCGDPLGSTIRIYIQAPKFFYKERELL